MITPECVSRIGDHWYYQCCYQDLKERRSIKAEMSGVEGGAPIMGTDHPALQELLKLNVGEPLSPVLCLALFKDAQRCHF